MAKSQKYNWIRFLIPKEHGAWAMWVLPFIIGVAEAGKITLETILIFIACLMAFAARTAFSAAIRARRKDSDLARKIILAGIVEIMIVSASAAPMIITGNFAILPIGMIATLLFIVDLWWIQFRVKRNTVAEIIGVAGFSLTAPTAYIATIGSWAIETVLLWSVAFIYFSGSVFYVKLRVVRMSSNTKSKRKTEKFYLQLNLIYVVMVVTLNILLSVFTWLPGWLIFAFLPWIIHILWDVFKWRPKSNIYRIG